MMVLAYETQHVNEANVALSIIEYNRIAYVGIAEMRYENLLYDYQKLIDFFEYITGFDHLIIDLQNNGGGYGMFFPTLVMAPNIAETMYFYNYMFFMGGEHSRLLLYDILSNNGMELQEIRDDNLFNRFPYFHADDKGLFAYYLRITSSLAPSRVYKGRTARGNLF